MLQGNADPFVETIPPLKVRIPIAPMAHRETKFTRQGFAVTDKEKRKYMIEVSSMLREFEGWFKGCRFVRMYVIFAFERPVQCPLGQVKSDWDNPHLDLFKSSAPDMDNCLKTLQDCLTYHVIDKGTKSSPPIHGAGILDDDSCIVAGEPYKVYARIGKEPSIIIHLSQISNRLTRTKKSK